MTTTYSVNGTFIGPAGGPLSGATVNAYKLSRCAGGVLPAQGAAVPGGGADAGPVTTGTAFGSIGAYTIALPTSEAYGIVIATGGVNYWFLFNGVNFADGSTNIATTGVVSETGLATTAITSGALPTIGAFSSGTGQQVSTSRDTTLVFSVTNTTVAGTCVVALSPDGTTYTTALTITSGVNGSVQPVFLPVPAGWRVKCTFSHATLSTPTYY